MLLKDILEELMENRHLSVKDLAALSEIKESKIRFYLDGAVPTPKDLEKLCRNMGIDGNDITYDELSMSINECAKLFGRSAMFIRSAIEQKKIPGICVINGENRSFHIPRKPIYTYLGMESNSHLMAVSLAVANEIKKSLPTSNDEATK